MAKTKKPSGGSRGKRKMSMTQRVGMSNAQHDRLWKRAVKRGDMDRADYHEMVEKQQAATGRIASVEYRRNAWKTAHAKAARRGRR